MDYLAHNAGEGSSGASSSGVAESEYDVIKGKYISEYRKNPKDFEQEHSEAYRESLLQLQKEGYSPAEATHQVAGRLIDNLTTKDLKVKEHNAQKLSFKDEVKRRWQANRELLHKGIEEQLRSGESEASITPGIVRLDLLGTMTVGLAGDLLGRGANWLMPEEMHDLSESIVV